MSTASKVTLALTSLSAVGIIIFVHQSQKNDQAAMHDGVIRDMERQRLKEERQADFAMSKALEDEYRKIQTVQTPQTGTPTNGR